MIVLCLFACSLLKQSVMFIHSWFFRLIIQIIINKKLSGSEFKKIAEKRLNDEIELLKKVPNIGSI